MPSDDAEERRDSVAVPAEVGLEERLDRVLIDLRRRARGVRGSVIADSNGLPVAVDIRGGTSPAVIAAMSTLVAQSVGSVFQNLSLPSADFVLMEGPTADAAVMTMSDGEVSLLTLIDKATNLGILKIEMRRASQVIAEALGFAFRGHADIAELFVLHKDGLLIRHYSDALRTDIDRDILGGMLVGVQDFVRQTLATKEGSLDQMRYGNYTIFFLRGTYVIAAAVTRDGDSEGVRYQILDALQEFEERYQATLKDWTGDVNAFPGIDRCFERVLRP